MYLGCKHSLAVANGTAALHLAYLALGLKGGGRRNSVPGFGFMAAANIALQLKAAARVFCGCRSRHLVHARGGCSGRANPQGRAQSLRCIAMATVCEMITCWHLAAKREFRSEDAAEAFGSRITGGQADRSGQSIRSASTQLKPLRLRGGRVGHHDDALAETTFRSHGLRRQRHYWHEVPGHNFRLTNLQAGAWFVLS